MSFKVLFDSKETTYDNPVTILDIVGPNRDYLCARVNGRVRELTYTVDKDAEIIPLTLKDRDAKPLYEASLRFLIAMAMHNLYPDLKIRFIQKDFFRQLLHFTS